MIFYYSTIPWLATIFSLVRGDSMQITIVAGMMPKVGHSARKLSIYQIERDLYEQKSRWPEQDRAQVMRRSAI